MVPGAPVATSGILFAVPAFREWLRLSARTPFARLLAVPPSVRSALCPFRPPPVPSSVSFALRSFFCLARLFLFLTPSSIWMGISGEDFPRGQLFCIFPSAGFQHTLIYLIYIRSECRFRTPPGTVLFCRSDAAASLPVCLSACLLVRRTFHLNFFSSAASFFLPPARPFCTLPHPSSVLFRRLLCLCSHFSRLIVPSRPNFFRLPHPSPLLPPDLLAPCHTLRPPFFAGRPSLIPAFRPSRHSPIRFFLRLPRPFSRLFPGNLPPRSEK